MTVGTVFPSKRLKSIVFVLFVLLSMIPVFAAVTHGPVVGAVTTNSAKVVVRTDAIALVYFEFDTTPDFTNPIMSDTKMAVADSDYFAICAVTGLSANTLYYYRTFLDGMPQDEVRSFQTFPENNSGEAFEFHFGSGQQDDLDPNSYIGNIFPVMAEDNPLFWLQIGDWTYPDSSEAEGADPSKSFALHYNRVLKTYEAKYDPNFPLNELLKVTSVDYVFDDHDMVYNNSDMTFPGIANSIRGYKAVFPHYPLANPNNGIWHKFTCGDADFFMLDPRTQRSPNISAFDTLANGQLTFTYKPDHLMLSANPNIDGELQIDWLIRELRESTATWKFLVSTVAFNPAERGTLELALLLQGTGYDPVDVPGLGLMSAAAIAVDFSDRWGGFPASVQKIVRAVHDYDIQNVIVLSGDSHNAAIDDGAHSFFPELMAGGLDRSNSQEVAMEGSFAIHNWNQGGQTYELNNFNNAYGRVTVFGADSVRLEAVDEFKQVITHYTVHPGYTVETVGLGTAPEGQSFGKVEIGTTGISAIVLYASGSDTVRISNITFTDDAFSRIIPVKSIRPGHARRLGLKFHPTEARPYQGAVIIESNAPNSPLMLPLIGEGVYPAGVKSDPENQPLKYDLEQNFPNPFNASTQIAYTLPNETDTYIAIFNSNGQLVREFRFDNQSAGRHTFTWDGNDTTGKTLASGIYVVQMRADDYKNTKKVVLLK
ncbi:MAG: T9SS type A sorting domain-containing protein [Calditrichaeota bacterium]|nr:T9SS type A sorting domain-containing protein [Calditrichota bacterium]